MADERLIRRYRNWYATLLRLYPKPYRERFGEPMEQTFADLLRKRAQQGRGLFGYALWILVETSAGILKERINVCYMRNKNISYVALATVLILLIPLIAMQFTSEVNWTLFDFVFAGTLIFGTGCLFELARRRAAGNGAYKIAAALALAAAFFLIWINGAVGIIGSESNPLNLMYLGVIGIATVGALIARFQPQGMARAFFATAIAQAMVPMIALIGKPHVIFAEPPGVVGFFALNSFFVVLFVGSALLFRRASATSLTFQ